MTGIESKEAQKSSVFDSIDNFLVGLKSMDFIDDNVNDETEPPAALDTLDDFLARIQISEFQPLLPSLSSPNHDFKFSRDWACRAHSLLGQIDVDRLCGLPGPATNKNEDSPSILWDSIFMNALTKTPSPRNPQQSLEGKSDPSTFECLSSNTDVLTKRTFKKHMKRRRVYKSRRVVPEHKDYVDQYNELDVICGRGARSNKHPGNRFYLRLVEERKPLDNDKVKREIVLDLLNIIHERGGRILDKKNDNRQMVCVSYKDGIYQSVSGSSGQQ